MKRTGRWLASGAPLLLMVGCGAALLPGRGAWSASEVELLRSLWIRELGPLAADPSNRYADDPAAVALGHHFFFDERFSGNGSVSCATCHLPGLDFQDGTALATGIGQTDRRTMPIAGTAYSPWQFWDGRSDSQWAQALGPLENPVEHGGSRAQYAHLVALHYRSEYEALFGPLPDLSGVPEAAGPVANPAARRAWEELTAAGRSDITRVYANIGKAIAAYERKIQYGESRFDLFVAALVEGTSTRGILNREELGGLRLFIGRGQCINCHLGPLFTNNDFHNTGVPAAPGLPPDRGRAEGALRVLADEFNCRSPYSDAPAGSCRELEFISTDQHELLRAFKVPSLRNVAARPPYMHAGQLATLGEVLDHYNRAPAAPAGHSELVPLRLNRRELGRLEAFLRTLIAPLAAPPELLHAPVRHEESGRSRDEGRGGIGEGG